MSRTGGAAAEAMSFIFQPPAEVIHTARPSEMFIRPQSRAVLGRLAFAAALAAALAGCQTIQEEHQNYMNRSVDVVNVVGNTWRISASWPKTQSAKPMTEWIYARAKDFCGEGSLGMMPLQGSSEDGSGDDAKPATAWLEFRCSNPEKVYQEYKGIKINVDEFLEDDDKN